MRACVRACVRAYVRSYVRAHRPGNGIALVIVANGSVFLSLSFSLQRGSPPLVSLRQTLQ